MPDEPPQRSVPSASKSARTSGTAVRTAGAETLRLAHPVHSTILVVDDNPGLLYASSKVLRTAGYRVIEASTGAECLRLAALEQPDIILLDVRLGDANGIEICRELKQRPQGPHSIGTHAFVVLVSGIHTSSDTQIAGLRAGADAYIARPIDNEELAARVEALLRIRRGESELRDQLEYTRAITSSMAEGVLVFDLSGRITFANPAAERILGTSIGTLIGRPLLDALGLSAHDNLTPTSDSVEAMIERVLKSEQREMNLETVLRGHEGSGPISVLVSVTPLHAAGTVSGGVLTFRDVSELKENERQIRELNENLERRVYERTAQLEQANRELEAFSYSVSHDLRAPFRHIAGFAQLLRERVGESLDPQSSHYLDTMIESARYAGGLIDDLLALARIGRTRLHITSVDVNRLVRECRASLMSGVHSGRAMDRLNPRPEHYAPRIEWSLGELPSVHADAGLLRLVFENLLSNALKYSRTREVARIEIGSERMAATETNPEEHLFYVRDNGVGFDMRYAKKLFGVFQRLHHNEEFEGTGIGLANVQRIIHRHGGTVWGESREGEGATFYFTIPLELSALNVSGVEPPTA